MGLPSAASGRHSPHLQPLSGQVGPAAGRQPSRLGEHSARLPSPNSKDLAVQPGDRPRAYAVSARERKPLALRSADVLIGGGEAAGDLEAIGGQADVQRNGREPDPFAHLTPTWADASAVNSTPNEGAVAPDRAQRREAAMALGKSLGEGLERHIQAIQSGDLPAGRKREAIAEAKVQHDSLLKECMKTVSRGAPRGQGLGQITALRAGVAQGRQAILSAKQLEATVASATTRHEKRNLGTAKDIGTWHATHNNALASNHKHETPHEFRMNFSLKHHAFWGASDFKGKVDVALKHLHAKEGRIETLGGDMRPYMQAGIELALRNGSQHITTKQAIALLETLCAQAGDPTNEHCLQPDLLRMVVAGMVAVWDPQVSAEVALHLLNKAQGGVAAPQSEEGSTKPKAARDLDALRQQSNQKQNSTVAEGLGLGMAWKGMDLIKQYAEAVPDKSENFNILLKVMSHGQSEGKHWLLRMEMALPGLSGKKNTDLVAQMEAVVLMRRFYIKHEPYVPSSTSSSTTSAQGTDWKKTREPGEDEDTGEETGTIATDAAAQAASVRADTAALIEFLDTDQPLDTSTDDRTSTGENLDPIALGQTATGPELRQIKGGINNQR